MKKLLFSLVSIVNMILIGIAFGLGANTAAWVTKKEGTAIGNWYQLVFPTAPRTPAVANIICFCLLVLGAALVVFALLPFKFRKFVNIAGGGALIAAGVLTLWVPTNYMETSEAASKLSFYSSGSLIAMAVLLLVAGGLALAASCGEILLKDKEAK